MTDLTATKPENNSLTRPRTKKGTWTEADRETVEKGLIAVALCNGNFHAAERMLTEQGCRVHNSTLRQWQKGRYAALYEDLQEQVLPKIRARAAEGHMEAADAAIQVEKLALERLKGKIDELPARDLPGAVRNLTTTAGIHRDKARDLRGEASLVTGTDKRDLKKILKALKGKGIQPFIEAEVVEEATVADA